MASSLNIHKDSNSWKILSSRRGNLVDLTKRVVGHFFRSMCTDQIVDYLKIIVAMGSSHHRSHDGFDPPDLQTVQKNYCKRSKGTQLRGLQKFNKDGFSSYSYDKRKPIRMGEYVHYRNSSTYSHFHEFSAPISILLVFFKIKKTLRFGLNLILVWWLSPSTSGRGTSFPDRDQIACHPTRKWVIYPPPHLVVDLVNV
ncbi:hypothetical protein J6590_003693 [Homalodisca vitripennis]|nr:hypothetical protein J6590_003693 [Homalodisca vitripennis]